MPENSHHILTALVNKVACKPGWSFSLRDENGALRLVIQVDGHNSDHPEDRIVVSHFFPVPMATYNEATWKEWIFSRCQGVENHELGEWFRINGHQPFRPLHGPGEDPYTVHFSRPVIDQLTTQDGSLRNVDPNA